MPAREHNSQLRALLTFYDSVTHVTPEGDSLVSEETLEGLGTAGSSCSILHSLFGSILRVAFPFGYTIPARTPPAQSKGGVVAVELGDSTKTGRAMDAAGEASHASLGLVELEERQREPQQQQDDVVTKPVGDGIVDDRGQTLPAETVKVKKKHTLTDFIPHSGYFLAGAIAGGVSRTATAPLDRLKVYLLVNTNNKATETAAAALKQGRPVAMVKNAVRPIGDAVRDLFRAGGLRGFFAGEI